MTDSKPYKNQALPTCDFFNDAKIHGWIRGPHIPTKAHLAESEEPGLLESLAAAAAQAEQQLEEGRAVAKIFVGFLP